MKRISPGQQRTIEATAEFFEETGAWPTAERAAEILGITRESAYGHFRALLKKGYYERVGQRFKPRGALEEMALHRRLKRIARPEYWKRFEVTA